MEEKRTESSAPVSLSRWPGPEHADITKRSTARALAWAIPDFLAWIGFVMLAVAPLPLPINVLASILAGLFIGVLFVVGHDASHQALTPHRQLNLWLARLAFLPSAHPESLWHVFHNQVHHGYTNLRGHDFVWEPWSPEKYQAASPIQRAIYRLYRSYGWGPFFYYFFEMWLRRHFLPIDPAVRPQLKKHLFDTVFMLVGQVAIVAMVIALGNWLSPDRPAWLHLILGWLIPFLFFIWLFGLTIYFHHTHPRIAWFDDPKEWSVYRGRVIGCAEAHFPGPLDWIDNNIMDHAAHHLHPGIPMYNLRRAQRLLRQHFPEIVEAFVIKPSTYKAISAACKLYDSKRRQWLDFNLQPTGPVLNPGNYTRTEHAQA